MPKRPAVPSNRRAVRATAIVIFAVALLSRLHFWLATPDRVWGWSKYFEGDAPLWLEYARAIDLAQPFELGLPIHPPGAAWLTALLWDGSPSGILWLRFVWVLMGAFIPLLVFVVAQRSFGLKVAAVAGGWCALSTGLLILSASINSETPYLLLVVGSFWFIRDLQEKPTTGRIAVWSILNAIACLFRVEHLVFYVLALGFFAMVWIRRNVVISLIFFVLALVPWHVSAWSAIHRFNEEPRALTTLEEQAVSGVEQTTAHLSWTVEAHRRREELPGFLRRTLAAFVLSTVDYRGGRQVRGEDLDILEQAFGYYPRRLNRFPFVLSAGPLNFYLANNPAATGGFDRTPLEQPPPLSGGPYPPFLVQGLPPEQLTFFYPPHLHIFNEGYSLGWTWIRQHPKEFARLAARKLSIFWSGAAQGLTAYNFPMGLSGIARPVDMVVPQGAVATGWRILLLAISLIGLAAGWRRISLWPWLLFLLSKVVVTVLFFGYARMGATVIPVLALLWGFVILSGAKRPVILSGAKRSEGSPALPRKAVRGNAGDPSLRSPSASLRSASGRFVQDDISYQVECLAHADPHSRARSPAHHSLALLG